MPLPALKAAALRLSWALQCHSCHGPESTSTETLLQAHRAGCTAGMWMESRRKLGAPHPPQSGDHTCGTRPGMGHSDPCAEEIPLSTPSSPVRMSDWCTELRMWAWIPSLLQTLMSSSILPPGICAVCKAAPSKPGGEFPAVSEVLISLRVKRRTHLWPETQKNIPCVLPAVCNSLQTRTEASALCRTSTHCVLCVGWLLKHSPAWSFTLGSSQPSTEQILPLNDLLSLVFESHQGEEKINNF